MPRQDKAELSRLAFKAGTKQALLETLEAPDKALPFHAAAAAKPQPCSRAPTEAAVKGRAPHKWRGGQGQRDRRDFQRFRDWFQRSGSNESQRDLALLSSFEAQQFVMKRSLPAHNKLQQSLQQSPNPAASACVLLRAKSTAGKDILQPWREGLSLSGETFSITRKRPQVAPREVRLDIFSPEGFSGIEQRQCWSLPPQWDLKSAWMWHLRT